MVGRVLVVEDDARERTDLAETVASFGYQVATATDGKDALQKLASFPANAILTDLMMPRMDGIGFLEAIRRDPKYQDLPVILVTAAHDRKKVAAAMALGVRDYIFKADCPFTRLLGIVQKNLGEVPQEPAKGN